MEIADDLVISLDVFTGTDSDLESYQRRNEMSWKDKLLWYLTETIAVPVIVSVLTTLLFQMFF